MEPVYGHKLFNRAFDIMGKALHLRLGRQSMTATNLANMDTPGYRVRDLKFEEAMERAIGPPRRRVAGNADPQESYAVR